jgi:ATP-binding cassette subfamily B protein
MVVGSVLSLLDPLVVKWLIDVALPKQDLRLVLLGTLVFCAVYLASLGTNYLASFVGCLLTQKMVFRIRVSLLRKIHSLPTNRDEDAEVKDTLYRIEQDVDRVAELSGDILPLTIQMVLMGVMVLVTMGILNWHLTLLVAAVLPIFYVLQRSYAAKLKDAADQVQTQFGRINAFLQEHLAGMMQLQTAQSYRHADKRICPPCSDRSAASSSTASHGNGVRRSIGVGHRSWHGSDPRLWRLRSNSRSTDGRRISCLLRLCLSSVRAGEHRD